jgi:hypothetical protein
LLGAFTVKVTGDALCEERSVEAGVIRIFALLGILLSDGSQVRIRPEHQLRRGEPADA